MGKMRGTIASQGWTVKFILVREIKGELKKGVKSLSLEAKIESVICQK